MIGDLQKQNNIIVIGSPEDGEILLDYEINLGHTLWSVTKSTAPGDRVWFYITHPVSAVVATGIVNSEVIYHGEANQSWSKHYVATINNLKIVRNTPLEFLQKAFPQWQGIADFEENFDIEANQVGFFHEVMGFDNGYFY